MSMKRGHTGKRQRGLGGSETRESVMDTAEAHLVKYGYMGVSLEDIAKEVGVTKPALYYHFPRGKEQLFVEIAHRAMRRTREGIERAMSAKEDGAGKLRAAARWLMGEREKGQPMEELRDVANFVGEEHQAELAESFYGALYGPIHRAVAQAIEADEFREANPNFLTWAFLGLVSGMMSATGMLTGVPTDPDSPPPPGISDGDISNGEKMAEHTVELFLNGALK